MKRGGIFGGQVAGYVLTAALCLGLTSCGTTSNVEQLGNGYERVDYITRHFSEPESSRIALRYHDPNERRMMIWPEILGMIVTNDVVIFEAGKAFEPPYPDESRATGWRLFAVRAPDMPLDITGEVLWRWSRQSKGDFAKLLNDPGLYHRAHIGMKEKNGVLECETEILNTGSGVVHFDLRLIADIMREVKENGVVRKDRVWGAKYIEKVFPPQAEK